MTADKIEFIFQVIEAADISVMDFHRLTQISRESLYRWKRGGSITDKFRLGFAYTAALRIDAATKDGKLPLPNKLKTPARIAEYRRIIRETK